MISIRYKFYTNVKNWSVAEDFLESVMGNVPFQGAAWAVGSKALLFYIPARFSNQLVRELCSLSREQELSQPQPILKSKLRQEY